MSSALRYHQRFREGATSGFDALRQKHIQLLLLIILLGAFLRFFCLGCHSIWLDEAWTVGACSKDLQGFAGALQGYTSPPLYFVLTWFVVHLFGVSEFVIRFPSAVFGVLSIPLMYVLGRRLFSYREGLLSAFLLAISVFHIYYSQEARMYPMVFFLVLLGMLFFWEALHKNRWRLWAGFVACMVLGVYTHYFVGLLVFSLLLFFILARLFFPREVVHVQRSFWISMLVLIVLSAPLCLSFYQGSQKVLGSAPWGLTLYSMAVNVLGSFSQSTLELKLNSYIALFVFCFMMIIGIISVYEGRIHEKKKLETLLLCSWLFIPIIISYGMVYFMPFMSRYILFSLIPYLLLVSSGILSLSQTKSKDNVKSAIGNGHLRITLLLILIIAVSINPFYLYYTTPKQNDWKGVSAYLEEMAHPGDAVIVLPGGFSKPLTYYYNPHTHGTILITNTTLDSMNRTLSEYNNTWVVVNVGSDGLSTMSNPTLIANWIDEHLAIKKQILRYILIFSSKE